MNMMKRIRYLFGMIMLLAALNLTVHADAKTVTNPTTVTLKAGIKYTAYDVTGDRKADTFKLSYVDGGYADGDSCYKGVNIYVNGKKVGYVEGRTIQYTTFSEPLGYYTLTAKLYTLKNGKVFLYLYGSSFNNYCSFAGLYQYKSGKFRKAADLYSVLSKFGVSYGGTVSSVSGNKITVSLTLDCYSTGYSYISYVYTWKSGKLVRGKYGTYKATSTWSDYADTSRVMTTNKKLTTYKSPGSSKKAFTVKKGAAVKITKCRLTGGKLYIRIKYGSKYGWIKALTKYPGTSGNQFANAGHVN